ncbi:SsrA-binding protein [Candidatus Pantoea edessiphila]|uniref:SsrA-binding protein n=1 Tax=Candidatus Pantoea edessiphila TaxID=2044610 RepID=A0A2P5SYC7_9GAMM|nr:SsrA-binding protein SmpB [Candidatus Pantoea edessiphila]MBK4775537.1 SsrA-binding protein SmpB [Pantoea sp. Edef]PPI87338.1 SsrA-binding protein [Candidatus Pantoea edessiphila]
MKKQSSKTALGIIAKNRRAYYEYFIEKEIEAGLVLYGWEMKSIRAGKINISDSYILIYNQEAYLLGSIFQPLINVSNNITCDPTRNRKLLLNKSEINYLNNRNKQKNYTTIALVMYWKRSWCKLKIGLSRGKKQYDKRDQHREREWKIHKERILKILKP